MSQNDGWTFVYATPLPFARIGYGIGTEEMEDLWRKLLGAPTFGRAEWPRVSPPNPGEVHIRPQHRV